MATTHRPTPRTDNAQAPDGRDFHTGEGLRRLLQRLHEAGPRAWAGDLEVAELMAYVAVKYEPLARKHGLDTWEAASAAFDVMRTKVTCFSSNVAFRGFDQSTPGGSGRWLWI